MAHSGKMIIVGDMGELKSYKVQQIPETGRLHVEMVNDIDYIAGRQKMGDTLSDDRGHFGRASGENLNAEHEVEQHLVHQIAGDISSILANASEGSCYLAFPTKHHKELTAALSDRAKKALAINLAADLVKCPADELLSHFQG